MRLVKELLNLFLISLTQIISLARDVSSETNTVNLGAYFFYDRQIYNNIRDNYGHDSDAERGTPNAYFAAFVGAVELAFRDMKNINIQISLVNSTLLNDDRARDVLVAARGYDDTINGTETMDKFRDEVSQHAQVNEKTHVLFLATVKYIMTEFYSNKTGKKHYLYSGLPVKGGVCGKDSSIGLVTDDGKTFRGVQEVAQQIAILLGASIDNDCSKMNNGLPPSVFDGDKSTMSNCSKEEITQFLSKKGESENCWTKPVQKFSKVDDVLPAQYNNNTGFDVCTAGTTSRWRDVRECEIGDRRSYFNRTCQVQCCEHNSRFAKNGLSVFIGGERMADGAPCGDKKICIFGKCENRRL